MTPEVAEIVGRKDQPRQLTDLCQRLKDLVKLSRDEMCKNYDRFDYHDEVYRGERKADAQDLQARRRKEPEKLILPLTFGQTQTFVAFGHSLYNQRDYFYEMLASGQEDETPAQVASALLEHNLNKNKFRSVKLIQFLTDIARFGIGITKETWVHDKCPVVQEVPDPNFLAQARAGMIQPAAVPMIKQITEQTKYLGNKIINVSPYRWFPDVRLPLTRWSEGEFCADEIEESRTQLEKMEKQGLVAGIQYVPRMSQEAFTDRRLNFLNKGELSNPQVNDRYILLTEVQIRLNPAQTEIDEGVMLDKEYDYETIYICWIANDGRIIRLLPAGYDHEEFGYNCAQLFDDQNRFINFSLADVLTAIQDTATWFINSHITSVRKTIFTQMAVDPAAVEIDDIIKRSPIIRLKPSRAGSGVDSWIKQLQTQDTTANHLSDVTALSSLGKEATGINETILGQFSSGRRSAKEAGNVMNAAANRLIMLFASIWESGLEPQGRKMLSNLRQGLDEQTMVRMYGLLNTQELAQPDLPGVPPPLYRLIKVSKADLVGNYDFAPFNGTLPSQRAATAAVLKEILDAMQKDPRMVMLTGLDPQLLFFEVLTLLNIRNVKRFKLTPERLQQLAGMAQLAGNAGSPRPAQAGGRQPQGPARPSNPKA
jgi:hypothetical protein